MNDDFELPELSDNPTPEERAQFVILRLEQFIRDGRTFDEGMSFKIWQQMAKIEIANALAEAENSHQKDDVITKRLMFISASAMVTVGFWGTAVSMHRIGYLAGGIICLVAGLFMMGVACEWRIRKWRKRTRAEKRAKSLARVEDLNRRIKRLENDLEKYEKVLKKEVQATARAAGL